MIPKLHNISQISAGKDSSLAVTNDGIIYAFGNNDWGKNFNLLTLGD